MKNFFLHYLWGTQKTGRITFAMRQIIFLLAGNILYTVMNNESTLQPIMQSPFKLLMLILCIVSVPLGILSNTHRRLLDLERPQAWNLLSIVPYINLLFWLYLAFVPGKQGPKEELQKPQ